MSEYKPFILFGGLSGPSDETYILCAESLESAKESAMPYTEWDWFTIWHFTGNDFVLVGSGEYPRSWGVKSTERIKWDEEITNAQNHL